MNRFNLRSVFCIGFVLMALTLLSSVWGAEPEMKVRVRLVSEGDVTFTVSMETEVYYRTSQNRWALVENVRMTPGQTWTASLQSGTGKLQLTTPVGDRLTSSHSLQLRPIVSEGSIILLGHEYGGNIQLIPLSNKIEVFNEVGLEEYIAGVLYGETIPSWNMEALKAQAVASRTYALNQIGRHKTYDYCDQTHCQRYRGRSNFQSIMDAVASTRGEVLLYKGKLINAFYHSSSGGMTENNDDIWGGEPLPYLRSVADYDDASDKYRWQMPGLITVKELLNRLGLSQWDSCEIRPIRNEKTQVITDYVFRRYGGLQSEQFSRETIRWRLGLLSPRFQIRRVPADQVQQALKNLNSGPVRIVRSTPNGETIQLTLQVDVEIEGEVIDSPVTLNANEAILISGRGFGHGVGLSQWGSQGLAQMGKGYHEILRHYYGSDVVIEKRYE